MQNNLRIKRYKICDNPLDPRVVNAEFCLGFAGDYAEARRIRDLCLSGTDIELLEAPRSNLDSPPGFWMKTVFGTNPPRPNFSTAEENQAWVEERRREASFHRWPRVLK